MTSKNQLELLHKECRKCKECSLAETRTNVVVAKGNPDAKILIIGEGPGEQEDVTGFPFVGRAGKMLDSALNSVEIDPLEDCYITNIVKCRPPNNRKPSLEEVKSCIPWLDKQIDFLDPKIIVLAGSTAVESFLNIKQPISKIRGEWIEKDDIKVMPIFHPSYLLRNPSKEPGKPKWLTWQDLKKVKKVYDSF